MAEFQVRTKGGADTHGRSRVYFCCHPDDFDKYFDRICEDIFKTHEPAIYYTADMSEPLDETNINVDLARMNLFIVPVTFRLMNEPNRAMQVDIAYAKEHNILILPFMMESGIDVVYALPKNFGERQYIMPDNSDLTAISYEEKLRKFLDSTLISDEMAKRVRAAFDAYIFLSYRKKDRAYANELMRIIHNIPGCRDIAIWYDEFLTPGESFIENIEKAMGDSKLFALLVTPSLLEYVDKDGKLEPNFVMDKEYPAAKRLELDILPTEMVETDRGELKAKYDGIPEPVRAEDEFFTEALLSVIKNIAISENDNDPEHNFLIGLAYLDGIDVERNAERGLELITKAAEAELPEAMEKLYLMFMEGKNVELNYREALKWAERLVDFCTKVFGEEHPDALTYLSNLAYTYGELGDYQNALKLNIKVYELKCKVLGEEHPDTLTSMSNLASTYGQLGDHQKALELNEKVYELFCRILGEEHPDTLNSLNNLAYTYGQLGDHQKALELNKKVYELSCKVLGEEHPDTLKSLGNLAYTYGRLGNYQKALELQKNVYELSCKVLGEEHPSILTSLNNLAYIYGQLGNYQKAFALNKKTYELSCKLLGEEHPSTLTSLNNLASTYSRLGDYQKELELNEKVYKIRCKILSEEHPDTLISLNNLGLTYSHLGDHKKALELKKKVYELQRRILGEEHPDTLRSLSNLASTYSHLGDHKKALELQKKVYELRCKTLGEEHPDTLTSLNNIAVIYYTLGEKNKSLEHFEKLYTLQCKVYGLYDPMTIQTAKNIFFIKQEL